MKLHSVVDQITNSSTEIFSFKGQYTIDTLKELLVKLMPVLRPGCSEEIDKYFTIKYDFSIFLEDNKISSESDIFLEYVDSFGEKYNKVKKLDPWDNREDFLQFIVDNKLEGSFPEDEDNASTTLSAMCDVIIIDNKTGEKLISAEELAKNLVHSVEIEC